jgi:hypothetical protein
VFLDRTSIFLPRENALLLDYDLVNVPEVELAVLPKSVDAAGVREEFRFHH